MPSKYGRNKRMVKMIKLEKKRKSREKKVLKNSDRRKTSPDISQYKISHPSPNFFLPFFRLRINNSSFRFSYFFFRFFLFKFFGLFNLSNLFGRLSFLLSPSFWPFLSFFFLIIYYFSSYSVPSPTVCTCVCVFLLFKNCRETLGNH